MVEFANTWWESSGATSLITGFFTVLAATLGYLARPWVEARIRREAHHETTQAEWADRSRELTADLTSCLWGLAFPTDSAASRSEAQRFLRELERPLLLVRRYAPDDQLRGIAADVFDSFRMATSMTLLLSHGRAERDDEDLVQARQHALDDCKESLDRMVKRLTPRSTDR